MSDSYQCLEDRVLIRPIKKTDSETTQAGIILDTVKKEVAEGEVFSVGAGRYAGETGEFIPTVLGRGDTVLYGINAGMPIDVPDETGTKVEMKLMREGDVLLLVKKSE